MNLTSVATTLMHILTNNVIPILFVLSLIIFVHELGHFIVGRLCGVGVSTFSLGFGPELFGFNDRHGTHWRLAAIPLGGYVKFYGDQNAASMPDPEILEKMTTEERSKSLPAQPIWARAAIVAAGPLANFLLAIVIFAGVAYFYGKQTLSPRIERVEAASAAEAAGFLPGDLIVKIDGQKLDDFFELKQIVSSHAGVPMTFVVERGGQEVPLVATPVLRDEQTPFGKQRVGILGIAPSRDQRDVHYTYPSLPGALVMGVSDTFGYVEKTLTAVAGMIVGRESASQISGLLGMGQAIGVVASWGFVPFLIMVGWMSVSIGLINLFPIPILDGGHLLFYAIEASRGRPLSEKVQEASFRVGLALIVALLLFANVNDLWRWLAPS
jgi:regulator of sigma E protease